MKKILKLNLILFLLLSLFVRDAGAAAKLKPADYNYAAFHYKMTVGFKISDKATEEIIIRRNVPRSFEHQSIKNEKLSCRVPGNLILLDNKYNRYIEYNSKLKDYLDYCHKNGTNPYDTIEISYECDYVGFKTNELVKEKYPFRFYKVKPEVEMALKNKLMSILNIAVLPYYTNETELKGDLYGGLAKVFEYVNKNVLYTRQKQKRDIITTLNSMNGNCISKTNLWRAFIGIVGIKSCNVTCIIMSRKNKNVTHRISLGRIGGKAVPFCPTNKHFALLPAHYMVLSFVKKDNYACGIKKSESVFDITPVKRGMDLEEVEEEILGEDANVMEPEILGEY